MLSALNNFATFLKKCALTKVATIRLREVQLLRLCVAFIHCLFYLHIKITRQWKSSLSLIIQLTTVSKDSSHCSIRVNLRPKVSPNLTRESLNLSIVLSQNK